MENLGKFLVENQWVIWAAIVWTLPWKAAALWRSARNGQRGWFAAIFILNTLAILDMIYLFNFSASNPGSMPDHEDPSQRNFLDLTKNSMLY